MSSFDDYQTEMSLLRGLDDTTIEKLVAGETPAATDLALVASFCKDLRAQASGPVPAPSPALQAVLASGLPVDSMAAVAAPAPPHRWPQPATGKPAPPRARRVGWGARLAGATLFTKVTLGVTMAAASITGAAAAGVPLARDVVEAVSPVDFPDPEVTTHDETDRSRPDDLGGADAGEDSVRQEQPDAERPQPVDGVPPSPVSPPPVPPTTAVVPRAPSSVPGPATVPATTTPPRDPGPSAREAGTDPTPQPGAGPESSDARSSSPTGGGASEKRDTTTGSPAPRPSAAEAEAGSAAAADSGSRPQASS